MLENLANLINQIEAAEATLAAVEQELNTFDAQRLAEAVRVSKKGLVYTRIWANKETHNCNTCYHPAKYTWHSAKGALVATRDAGSELGQYGGVDREEELWLLEDGGFAVSMCTGEWSKWQNAWNRWERTQPQRVEDPLAAGWTCDEILRGIIEALEERLKKLGERCKAQQARLEKVRALEVK